jgi:hypothetical protein
MSDVPFEDQLQRFPLLANRNAAELWPLINLTIVGWACLIFVPKWKRTPQVTLFLPLVYSYIYVGALVSPLLFPDPTQETPEMDFMTFAGVVNLLKDPNTVFAAWIHYVAFDLIVARFMVLDSIERGVTPLMHAIFVVPCVIACMFLGPSGYLAYIILRYVFIPATGEAKTKSS